MENRLQKLSHLVPLIRVSTDEQSLSIEAQGDAIRAWAVRHAPHAVILPACVEEDVTGGTEIEDRPGLLDAINLVEDGYALVVAKRDRLARDVFNVAMIERMVGKAGGFIVSAAGEGTEDDDPTSVMLRQILDVFAQHERAIIALRTRRGLAILRRDGRIAGTVPLGSARADDGGRSKTSGTPNALAPCPAEAQAIALICALYNEGLNPRAIVARLREEGIRPRPARNWSTHTVRRLARLLREDTVNGVVKATGMPASAVLFIEHSLFEGMNPKLIARSLRVSGVRPPDLGTWHHSTIRLVLKNAGIYRAGPRRRKAGGSRA